jgi:O-antigen biosynthesis protein
MPPLREVIKRSLPPFVKDALVSARESLGARSVEDAVLHDYELVPDLGRGPRLTMIIPTISPTKAFGGVITGLDIFLEIAKRSGAEPRIVLDEFGPVSDDSVVAKCARNTGVDPSTIEIVPRTRHVPRITVRSTDIFCSFNWWITLNIRPLLREQSRVFQQAGLPHLYALQDYDPFFYPFSTTQMMARLAYEPRWPCWGLFNSHELHDFFHAQGHSVERAFVFEPQLSKSLRPFLEGEAPMKAPRILVYGRPSIPRNCYPSIEKGLALWAQLYPEFSNWEVVSAGVPHPPMTFGPGRMMKSLGKLSLEDYGALLRTTAVGVSLMASPHPSYPPLEMSHFGMRTITNTYANKDLATSHPNILSIGDVAPDTIADALASACRAFVDAPDAGWTAKTLRPSFLETGPFPFLPEVAGALRREIWADAV